MGKLGNLQERWQPGHRNTMTAVAQERHDPLELRPEDNGLRRLQDRDAYIISGPRLAELRSLEKRERLRADAKEWQQQPASVRRFETGATRDSDEGKNDYEGFLSPIVIEAFGDYMTEHRRQSDGSLRDSDNWQRGIPKSAYMKSLLRHVITAWKLHRGWPVKPEMIGGVLRVPTMRETLCAILFNVQGYLHELLSEDLHKTEAA